MVHLIGRRTVLGGMAAAGLASMAPAARARGFFKGHGLALGVQLYTVSQAARADLDGTLAKLARIGYRAVELAGFIGRTPTELREAARRAGLTITSCHISAQPMGDISLSDDLPKLAADLHLLGLDRVVMPMFALPANVRAFRPGEDFIAYIVQATAAFTADDWKRNAAFLNEKNALLRREGIALGYHNHNLEFAPIGDTTGFDILLAETSPDIFVEMDAGWVMAAGVDPVALLGRYPGRFRMMHVKDIKASTVPNFAFHQDPTEVGHGIIPWQRLLAAAYKAGVRDFFVEQEPPFTKDRFAALKISQRYLAGL